MDKENPFLKFYNGNNSSLQMSFLGDDTVPTHSLLSEGLTEGEASKGDDFFSTHLETLEDIEHFSELNPPENSAQRWEKQSLNLKARGSEYLDPEKPATGKYLHLYNHIIGKSVEQKDTKTIEFEGIEKQFKDSGNIVDKTGHEQWEYDPKIPEYQKRAAARNRGGLGDKTVLESAL